MYSATGYLTPTSPFDLAKSLDFLGVFPPMHNEQALAERSLTKAIGWEGRRSPFKPSPRATFESR